MKISIVIPVYNKEKYLYKCLESLREQTLLDYEIIAVNDGSTDDSLAILKECAKELFPPEVLKIINQQNGGQAKAKNVGILACSGDYITVIDSDDYVQQDYLETLYTNVISGDYDIAFCGYERVLDNGTVVETMSVEGSAHYLKVEDSLCMFFTLACGKIWKRRFLLENEILFSEGEKLDDLDFTIKCNGFTDKIKPIDYVGYKYREAEGSVSDEAYKSNMVHFFPYKGLENAIKFINSKEKGNIDKTELSVIKLMAWYGLLNLKNTNMNDIKKYCSYCDNILETYFANNNRFMSSQVFSNFALTTRMGMILFKRFHHNKLFPYMVYVITKIM